VQVGAEWEMPMPQNLDVFVRRLERAGLLVFDPGVEGLLNGEAGAERAAQSRCMNAVGLSRRKLRVIGRAHEAVRRLRGGATIADLVSDLGFHDQSHLNRRRGPPEVRHRTGVPGPDRGRSARRAAPVGIPVHRRRRGATATRITTTLLDLAEVTEVGNGVVVLIYTPKG
jgi:AraC-like DNA-binding protein